MPANAGFTPFYRPLTYSLFALLAGSWMLCATTLKAAESDFVPNTDYSPEQVVRIVIDALKTNSAANDDDGIATVFQFASPGNRSSTGPLPRFTQMIKRGFPDMLNHSEARYDPMQITDNTAVQAVWLLTPSGEEVGYAFQLGKQKTGNYAGMWMTEAVMPLGRGNRGGIRI